MAGDPTTWPSPLRRQQQRMCTLRTFSTASLAIQNTIMRSVAVILALGTMLGRMLDASVLAALLLALSAHESNETDY